MEDHVVVVDLGNAAGQPFSGADGAANSADAGIIMATCQAQTDSEDGGAEANGDAGALDDAGSGDGAALDASTLEDAAAADASASGAASLPGMPTFGGTPMLVSSSFSLAEGPLWDACRGGLLFVDVSATRIYLLNPPSQLTVIRENSNYANGLAFDLTGALWAAEMGGDTPGRVTRTDRAGNLMIAADHGPACTSLHTPDDLVVRSDGTVYFTDPTFPHGTFFNFALGTSPVYRLAPGTNGYQIFSEAQVSGPNGVELSPDEKTLYVNAYSSGQVLRYAVATNGSLTATGVVASGLANPDSLCVDAMGNLYVGVSSGLAVLQPNGAPISTIPIASSQGVTNCEFGGSDGKTLYVTAWSSLWRIDGMPYPGAQWQKNQRIPCR